MAKVPGKDTKPEIYVRKMLFSEGFRFRKNDKRYPGRPDIVLPKYKTVIFVNGCFWHGHKDCKHSKLPKSNVQYWTEKISKNIARDKRNIEELESLGWYVIVLWECEINTKEKKNIRIKELISEIQNH